MTVINPKPINSNDTKNPKKPKCQRLSLNQIDVPFPISDQLNAVITSYKERKITGKPPNCFLLYRKALVREFNNHGYYLPAKEISPIASEKWRNKPEIVKQEYRVISEDIAKILQDTETPRILTPENFFSQNPVRAKKDIHCELRVSKVAEDVIQDFNFIDNTNMVGVSEPTTPINQRFPENNHFTIDTFNLEFINVSKSNPTSQDTTTTSTIESIEPQNSSEPTVLEDIFDSRQLTFPYEREVEEHIHESANVTFQNSYSIFQIVNPPSELLLNLMDHESYIYFKN
ncbi:207_t:CDS:1 [Ambispora gerdemannii]|uniref:207_t:CDS:1 n=1 Tax=Ambispora gerdemannii TaxID=144530 RepID=A0A9N8W398_9GLOM|nr:207_t:CDS:1 [Ambispora gerdemannii]